MTTTDPKTFLWSNICQLVGGEACGVDSVFRRVRKGGSKVGRGTIQRIEEGLASTGLDSVTSIADALGVEVWQLLSPDLAASLRNAIPISQGQESELLANYRLLSPQKRAFVLETVKALPKEQAAQVQAHLGKNGSA